MSWVATRYRSIPDHTYGLFCEMSRVTGEARVGGKRGGETLKSLFKKYRTQGRIKPSSKRLHGLKVPVYGRFVRHTGNSESGSQNGMMCW